MKFLHILALVCSLSFGATAFAQVDYHWDAHGIGFSIPSNFKVLNNNAELFEAENANLHLTINPFQDESLTMENLASEIIKSAKELGFQGGAEIDEIKIDDFEGYYAEGTLEGQGAFFAILLDTKSSTNMVITLVYDDKSVDQAIKLLKSFYAYD